MCILIILIFCKIIVSLFSKYALEALGRPGCQGPGPRGAAKLTRELLTQLINN